MENTININTFQFFQFASILFTGLLAGLFYGYDCSVIKGLGNLQDDVYLQSFQSINKAIQNPYFFISLIAVISFVVAVKMLNFANCSFNGTLPKIVTAKTANVYINVAESKR